MAKKLSKEEFEYVKKAAENSWNMIIDVDQLRKAYKILTDADIATMKQIRLKLGQVYQHPEQLEVEEDGTTTTTTFKQRPAKLKQLTPP